MLDGFLFLLIYNAGSLFILFGVFDLSFVNSIQFNSI